MIGIIDYGLGNVQSFINGYRILGEKAMPINNPKELRKMNRLILPGVGSFDMAMKRLNESGLIGDIEDLIFNKSVPILGVCVGFQIMAKKSDEGILKGLGWLDAVVKKIENNNQLPLPHMGWNNINVNDNDSKLLSGVNKKRFYFLHSYHVISQNKDMQIASADYGGIMVAAASKKNIFGCQFHPEKSHSSGLQVLENFSKL